LQSKAIAIENDLRATLRNFGLKVGVVGRVKFEARIKELVESLPDLAVDGTEFRWTREPMAA
jgi:transposase